MVGFIQCLLALGDPGLYIFPLLLGHYGLRAQLCCRAIYCVQERSSIDQLEAGPVEFN